MTNDQWDQKERRHEYCPMHHTKAQEIEEAKASARNKVPIWVFSASVTILICVLGYMNYNMMRQNDLSNQQNKELMIALSEHIEESNMVITNGTRVLSQLGFYQKQVMEKLGLPLKDIPDYKLRGDHERGRK